MYFVEPAARLVTEAYQRELTAITRAIRARNTATSILYENLIPSWIPNSQYYSILNIKKHYCAGISSSRDQRGHKAKFYGLVLVLGLIVVHVLILVLITIVLVLVIFVSCCQNSTMQNTYYCSQW